MFQGKMAPKSLAIRSLVILAGTILAAFGCAAFVVSTPLGLDPVGAFLVGLGLKTGISYGNALNLVNVVLFIFLLIFNRKMIHIGTVIYTLLVGVFCDLFIPVLTKLAGAEPSIPVLAIFLVGAIFTFAFGLGLYQAAQLGAGPIDGANQTIAKWTKIPLKYERIGCDVLFALLGFLMGANVFVGTIIAMFTIGLIMGPTIVKMSPVVDRWTGVEPETVPEESKS